MDSVEISLIKVKAKTMKNKKLKDEKKIQKRDEAIAKAMIRDFLFYLLGQDLLIHMTAQGDNVKDKRCSTKFVGIPKILSKAVFCRKISNEF